MIKHFLAPIVHEEGHYIWWLPIEKPGMLSISSGDVEPSSLTCLIEVEGTEEDIDKIRCPELQEVEL